MKIEMTEEQVQYLYELVDAEACVIEERTDDVKYIRSINHARTQLKSETETADEYDGAHPELPMHCWINVLDLLGNRVDVTATMTDDDEKIEEHVLASELWRDLRLVLPCPLIGLSNAGCTIIAQKPSRFPHLNVVMAKKPDQKGFVIWSFNKTTHLFFDGDYFDSPYRDAVKNYNAALARFDERDS